MLETGLVLGLTLIGIWDLRWLLFCRFPVNSRWFVYAGVVNRQLLMFSSLPTFYAETVIYHKDYDDASHDYDIALMKLKFPIQFSDTIRPVCLPRYNQEFPAGKKCWISGWGHSSSDASLQVFPLISTRWCNSSCMYNGSLTPRMMCAGYKDGKVDACQGDSGGPLVCEDVYAWHLMGVVSWGLGCAKANYPGVYTKVTEFLDWIYNVIEVRGATLSLLLHYIGSGLIGTSTPII
uniref:Peptidase S1 domain-containing protein n=1 Tax=Callorhinchus milii TaxID=7868 RepID=A0A4W3HHA8_CALMI